MAREVCSVNSSERPSTTKMKPTEYMLATSSSVTASVATSSTRARIAAMSSKLKLTSSPPESDDSNSPNVGRLNSASPVVNSFSRISR